MVVVPERRIVSVGNFDIGPLAAALDFARIALAPVVTSANERAVKLLQAPYSGLSAGLAARAGSPDDALSELAVAGQAITVEARTLAHPVSYELASSVKGEGIEDRATMAPLSARRLANMVQLCARVAAIELVVAAQAIDLRAPGQLGLGTGRAFRMIRELVPFTQADGTLPADLEPVVELVARGDLNPRAPRRLNPAVRPARSTDTMPPCRTRPTGTPRRARSSPRREDHSDPARPDAAAPRPAVPRGLGSGAAPPLRRHPGPGGDRRGHHRIRLGRHDGRLRAVRAPGHRPATAQRHARSRTAVANRLSPGPHAARRASKPCVPRRAAVGEDIARSS